MIFKGVQDENYTKVILNNNSYNNYLEANYSNVNVAAYISSNVNSSLSGLWANAALQQSEITAANLSISGLQTQMTSNAALITGLQSQMTSNAALITNLQTEVTANAATLSGLQANVGSFYTYANATYQTQAGLPSAIAAYLPTYGGTIGGNITIGGNLTVQGNIITNNYEEIITGIVIIQLDLPENITIFVKFDDKSVRISNIVRCIICIVIAQNIHVVVRIHNY